MDGLIHFIKHFLGLCGEAHPSVLVSGGAFLTALGVYCKKIIEYIKNIF